MCSLGIPPHQEAHPLDGVHLQLVEVPEVLHGTLDKLRGDPLFRDVFGNGLDVLTLDPPHRPARVDDSERLVVEAHVGHDHPRRERLPHLVPLPEHQLHPEVRVDVLPAPLRAKRLGNLPDRQDKSGSVCTSEYTTLVLIMLLLLTIILLVTAASSMDAQD